VQNLKNIKNKCGKNDDENRYIHENGFENKRNPEIREQK
jgi:hypothetical protein